MLQKPFPGSHGIRKLVSVLKLCSGTGMLMLHGHEVSKDVGLYHAACTVDSHDGAINYVEFLQANPNKLKIYLDTVVYSGICLVIPIHSKNTCRY